MDVDTSTDVDRAGALDILLPLDRDGGVRGAIEESIRTAIRGGRLRLGARLPSTRALARELDVARGTVSDAYAQLAAEGYLATRQGAASVVAWVPPVQRWPAPTPPGRSGPSWDLRPGRVHSSTFPRMVWSRAVRRVLTHLPDEALGYRDSRGTAELRDALAAYLGRARGVCTTPDQIVVCGGFTQGLSIVCQALRGAGATTVAMEDPNASRYRGIAAESGLAVVPLACDGDGARAEDLDRLSADAVVVTPAHQYPLGVTLSVPRRRALVDWARRRGAFVVEDDYDGEFRFDRRPVGALQQMDPDHVVYAGTASKTLAPGLRLGWLTVPPALRGAITAVKERLDRGNGVLDQLTLAELITSGEFDRHVRRMRTTYRRRRDELLAALSRCQHVPAPAGVAAGLHLVVPLVDGAVQRRVLLAARDRGLLLHTLDDYWHETSLDRGHGIVVGYGTPAGHAFGPAVEALVSVLRAATTRP